MKKLSYTLILVFFTATNSLLGQIEYQIFREGLYMATALGNDNFESIELFLKEKEYYYDDELSKNGYISYVKFSDNGSAISIAFHFGEEVPKVSFLFSGSDFTFLSRKLNTIIERSQFIDPVENGYTIFFPNSSNRNKDESNIGFISFFYLKDNYISFETPYHIVDYIDWETLFLNLPNEFFK